MQAHDTHRIPTCTFKNVFAALMLSSTITATHAAYAPNGFDLSQAGISGAWYDPASTGQGFVISVVPLGDGSGDASYFAGWFTYSTKDFVGDDAEASGRPAVPLWLTVQGKASDLTAAAPGLGLYTTNGKLGLFDMAPRVATIPVGHASLAISDCEHIHFHYQTDLDAAGDAKTGDMDLVRLLPNLNCSNSQPAVAPVASAAGLSGVWFDPAASGQGFAFDIHPSADGGHLFGGWFTYLPKLYPGNFPLINLDPAQSSYTLQGSFDAGAANSSVGIYLTSGGHFAAPNTPATVISTEQVGTATVHFLSCSKATVAYQFSAGPAAGLSRTISLQRLGPAPADCQL